MAFSLCADCRLDPVASASGCLNLAVLATPGCFDNEKLMEEVFRRGWSPASGISGTFAVLTVLVHDSYEQIAS